MDNNTAITQFNVIKAIGSTGKIKNQLTEILKDNAPSFITSVLNLCKQSEQLAKCDPVSIWNSAMVAASMKLPIEPSLGYAYIIPYKDTAQFQMGYKGYKQLALRTGEYKCINVTDVREGEIRTRDRLSGQIEFDWIADDAERLSKPIIGYVSYFELHNGYSSTLYMTVEQLMEHAGRYSKMYQNDLRYGKKSSKWSDENEKYAMMAKTVTKLNLSKNAPLSVEMQTAVKFDQAVVREQDDAFFADYVDRSDEPVQTTPETDPGLADLNAQIGLENAKTIPNPAEVKDPNAEL